MNSQFEAYEPNDYISSEDSSKCDSADLHEHLNELLVETDDFCLT